MTASMRCTLLALALGLPGCAGGQSGTEGSDTSPCRAVDEQPLGADETTALGTPNEARAASAGAQTTSLRWFDHSADGTFQDTELTLEVVADVASARQVTHEATGCPVTAECVACPNTMELDAALTFETTDGAFAETFAGTLTVSDGPTVTFGGALPASELRGTYDASAILPIYREPEYTVNVWFSPDPSGSVWMSGGETDNDSTTSVASAMIAEFPSLQ